jgi:hypothetical protein
MRGSLFTRDFLEEGIKETEAWRSLDESAFAAFEGVIRAIYAAFNLTGRHNEATTEADIIFKVLGALGWTDYLPQQTASERRTDVPDALLFASEGQKALATAERKPMERYRFGLAILENKSWQTPLDRDAGSTDTGQGVPSNQILRYLTVAEVQSDRRIKWGFLTNGRHWRLYYQLARSRSEDFLELDIPELLGLKGFTDLLSPSVDERKHWLKVLLLLFRRASFLPSSLDGRSFLEVSLDEGKLWEARVAKSLSELVFEQIFPQLLAGLVAHDPKAPAKRDAAYLGTVKDSALILLYRLLFVLYAEDRNLLPVRDKRYDAYSMRDRLRRPIAQRIDSGDTFADTLSDYYPQFLRLCRAIDRGERSLGLPPYNGGLFDAEHVPLLERAELPDAIFAPIVDQLSRRMEGARRRWINYRDLTVQQLGSIYERLLEFNPVVSEDRSIVIQPNIFARKKTGSYYTPEELVHLIIEDSVGQLVEDRRAAFRAANERLAKDRRPKKERIAELAALDPATKILELRICDPAMGSGHFLVSLVDYLADEVLEAVAEAEALASWSSDPVYRSPLTERIGNLRQRILSQAKANKWAVDEAQLDDRHIVRRIILKRVIHGVDMNPMAVELAKVALWLHTFTVGAPLSFLDHHLRVGNSLFGERLRPVMDELAQRSSLFLNPIINQARNAARGMRQIEDLSDADIAEVKDSAAAFKGVLQDTEALTNLLDLRQAMRWLGIEKLTQTRLPLSVDAIFSGTLGDPVKLIANGLPDKDDGKMPELSAPKKGTKKLSRADVEIEVARLLGRAKDLAAEQRFLHWQVAFPDLWDRWDSNEPVGGFDAVIGNPPWDRVKLQEIEWFEIRKPEIARAQTAAERKKMIAALYDKRDPLVADYEKAVEAAEATSRVARSQGEYPLLSRGDTNFNSLFVERGHSLIHPEGIVGMLIPSGIASDLSSSEFFRSVSSTGRLAFLYDFFNRRGDGELHFPDVYYRFKFCAYVAGGTDKTFAETVCGFNLRDVVDTHDTARCFPIAPSDFVRFNPNTGTAPIFASAQDAVLNAKVYRNIPVLFDNSADDAKPTWPVRYTTMFHMANDSNQFISLDRLKKIGAYPAARNIFKKGEARYLPLYEGKMVQAYDHRAADIVIVADNVFRPGQTDVASLEEHQDPNFAPMPRHFVPESAYVWPKDLEWCIAIKDVTSVTNTRTVIAAMIPKCGAGHTLPVLFPTCDDAGHIAEYKKSAPLLLANLNSFAYDYLVRQKVQGNHLAWFIVEQVPLLLPKHYKRRIGKRDVAELIRDHVLRLTYTATDMKSFANDQGADTTPFKWDEAERQHLFARLDAIFFMLYMVNKDDAAFILDTFSIVQKQDEERHGRHFTKELVLGYMAAFEAGDTETKIALH